MNINGEAAKVCVIYCRLTRGFWCEERQTFVPGAHNATHFSPDGAAILTDDLNAPPSRGSFEIRYMGSKAR